MPLLSKNEISDWNKICHQYLHIDSNITLKDLLIISYLYDIGKLSYKTKVRYNRVVVERDNKYCIYNDYSEIIYYPEGKSCIVVYDTLNELFLLFASYLECIEMKEFYFVKNEYSKKEDEYYQDYQIGIKHEISTNTVLSIIEKFLEYGIINNFVQFLSNTYDIKLPKASKYFSGYKHDIAKKYYKNKTKHIKIPYNSHIDAEEIIVISYLIYIENYSFEVDVNFRIAQIRHNWTHTDIDFDHVNYKNKKHWCMYSQSKYYDQTGRFVIKCLTDKYFKGYFITGDDIYDIKNEGSGLLINLIDEIEDCLYNPNLQIMLSNIFDTNFDDMIGRLIKRIDMNEE